MFWETETWWKAETVLQTIWYMLVVCILPVSKAHQGQWQCSHRWCLWEDTQYFAGKLSRGRKQFRFLEYAKQKEGNNTSISCHWTWKRIQKNSCHLIAVKLSTIDYLVNPGNTNICNHNCQLLVLLLNRKPFQKQIKGQD